MVSQISETKDIQVTFVNHNYAFNSFYTDYKNLCLKISKTRDINIIRKNVSAFIYDYIYSIPESNETNYYIKELKQFEKDISNDEEYKVLIKRGDSNVEIGIKYYKRFYIYFLRCLNLLSSFAKDLTSTFMPHTNLQKKLIKYSNNQSFYEKFIEFKRYVLDSFSEFRITSYMQTFNTFLTFYFAYHLFVNEKTKIMVDKCLSLIISKLLNKDVTKLLLKTTINSDDWTTLRKLDAYAHEKLLLCNSWINKSFSDYGILPKIKEKVYFDTGLI